MTTLNRKITFGQSAAGRAPSSGPSIAGRQYPDGLTELVAGAFASTPEKAKASGQALLIADARNYGSWQEMLEKEGALPVGERIDFVNIVTPNHMHFEPALAFVQAGFHVVLDKPMVHTSEQAQALVAAVEKQGVIFGVTHNYTGYPMVEGARLDQRRAARRDQRVVVEYPQGWLLHKLEDEGAKQAEWRTDPKRSGIAGAVGDIGSHGENLVSYMTGLELESLCAGL